MRPIKQHVIGLQKAELFLACCLFIILVWWAVPEISRTSTLQSALKQETLWNESSQLDAIDRILQLPELNVFMFWTTKPDTFQARHALVLDTYFYHHPNASVTLYTRYSFPNSLFLPYTKAGYQLKVFQYDDSFLLSLGPSCPPIQKWLNRLDEWQKGRFYYTHVTDLLRYCLLYKDGGLYSDMDALLLKRWDTRGTFIGKDRAFSGRNCEWCLAGDMYLAPGVMGSRPSGKWVYEAMRIAFGDPDSYNMTEFNAVGPKAITMAYKKLSLNDDIQVLPFEILYPYGFVDASLLVTEKDGWIRFERVKQRAASLHLFGHQTGKLAVTEGSVLDVIQKQWGFNRTNAVVRGPKWIVADQKYVNLPDIRLLAGEDEIHLPIQVTLTAKHGQIQIGKRGIPHSTLNLKSQSLAEMNTFLSRLIYTRSQTSRDQLLIYWSSSAATSLNIPIYDLSSLCTIIVKTIGRMSKVYSLVASIRKQYRDIRILVADDGENAISRRERDFEYIPLPFDVGLSSGRNVLVSLVRTEYFLTLDDDFLLDKGSNLVSLLHTLEQGYFDLAAGKNPVDERKHGFDFAGMIRIQENSMVLLPGVYGERDGCYHVDLVPNLFMAKSQLFQGKNALKWDEDLKLGEHEDFFWRLKQNNPNIKVATCPTVSFQHAHTVKQDPEYMKKRNRIYDFWKIMLRKHGFKRLVSFNHLMMDLIIPPPVTQAEFFEITSHTARIVWHSGKARTCRIVVTEAKHKEQVFEHNFLRGNTILLRDLHPETRYQVQIFAGNGFEHSSLPVTLYFMTESVKDWSERQVLKNGDFETDSHHWHSTLAVTGHVTDKRHYQGQFAGRCNIMASGYIKKSPVVCRLTQTVPITHSLRYISKWTLSAWSQVELVAQGTRVSYEMTLEAIYSDGITIQSTEYFDRFRTTWQVASTSLCLAPNMQSTLKQLRVSLTLISIRGAVVFDNVLLVPS